MNLGLVVYALRSMRTRKLRSWLTVLSVVIGITAITSLVSFGLGISGYVSEISQKMGNDKLIIQPRGFGFGPPSLESNVRIDDADVEVVEGVRGVEEATGVYLVSGEVVFNDQTKYAYVVGSDYEDHAQLIQEIYALTLAGGGPLGGNEKSKALLGHNYAVEDRLFGKSVKLRDMILVNGKTVKVGGFYEGVGNPQDDSNLYMNAEAVKELFGVQSYYSIFVRAKQGENPARLVEGIREALRDHRGQKRGNEDFFVQTFEQVIATFSSVLGIITGVVVLIACISIIVAGVNIMNTTYAAILERTKEIGVFKAIGAKNGDIMFIFVFEAALLSLVGGVLGVFFGFVISFFAGSMISQAGYAVFTPSFPLTLAIGSLVFAALIGLISAIIPARQASQLKPINALRYE